MHRFWAANFLSGARMIDSIGVSKFFIWTDDTVLTPEQRESGREIIGFFEENCVEIGLNGPAASLRRLLKLLSDPNSTDKELYEQVKDANLRLNDELLSRIFFSLSLREAEYYEDWHKGWEEVIARFPATISDVEEASKCFALSRYAAAVFHSTQIVEAGLIDLGTFIGVTDPKSGWTAVIAKLKAILAKSYPDLNQFEKDNREFLEQVYGTAAALNSAWRNKISHAQGKLVLLTADFTPEVAEEILMASRAFMRRLATEMPS